jgi:hypothetical protein
MTPTRQPDRAEQGPGMPLAASAPMSLVWAAQFMRNATSCEHYHHEEAERHEFGVPCPVEARIDAALRATAPAAPSDAVVLSDAEVSAGIVAVENLMVMRAVWSEEDRREEFWRGVNEVRAAIRNALATAHPLPAARPASGDAVVLSDAQCVSLRIVLADIRWRCQIDAASHAEYAAACNAAIRAWYVALPAERPASGGES